MGGACGHEPSRNMGHRRESRPHLYVRSRTVLYSYSITADSWTALGSAVPLSVGAGCTLAWLPNWDADKLVAIPAAGSANIYLYSIGTQGWSAALTLAPPLNELHATGSYGFPRGHNRLILHGVNNGRFYQLTPGASVWTVAPLYTNTMWANSAARVGCRGDMYTDPNGIEYLVSVISAGAYLFRVPLLTV
jgi:hypothetical protein